MCSRHVALHHPDNSPISWNVCWALVMRLHCDWLSCFRATRPVMSLAKSVVTGTSSPSTSYFALTYYFKRLIITYKAQHGVKPFTFYIPIATPGPSDHPTKASSLFPLPSEHPRLTGLLLSGLYPSGASYVGGLLKLLKISFTNLFSM